MPWQTTRSSRIKYDEQLHDIPYSRIREFVMSQDVSLDNGATRRRQNFANKWDMCAYADKRGIDLLKLIMQVEVEAEEAARAADKEAFAKEKGYASAADLEAFLAAQAAAAKVLTSAGRGYVQRQHDKRRLANEAVRQAEREQLMAHMAVTVRRWCEICSAASLDAFQRSVAALATCTTNSIAASSAGLANCLSSSSANVARCVDSSKPSMANCMGGMVSKSGAALASAATFTAEKSVAASPFVHSTALRFAARTADVTPIYSAAMSGWTEASASAVAASAQALAARAAAAAIEAAAAPERAAKQAKKDAAAAVIQANAAAFMQAHGLGSFAQKPPAEAAASGQSVDLAAALTAILPPTPADHALRTSMVSQPDEPSGEPVLLGGETIGEWLREKAVPEDAVLYNGEIIGTWVGDDGVVDAPAKVPPPAALLPLTEASLTQLGLGVPEADKEMSA